MNTENIYDKPPICNVCTYSTTSSICLVCGVDKNREPVYRDEGGNIIQKAVGVKEAIIKILSENSDTCNTKEYGECICFTQYAFDAAVESILNIKTQIT